MKKKVPLKNCVIQCIDQPWHGTSTRYGDNLQLTQMPAVWIFHLLRDNLCFFTQKKQLCFGRVENLIVFLTAFHCINDGLYIVHVTKYTTKVIYAQTEQISSLCHSHFGGNLVNSFAICIACLRMWYSPN